jgi:cytohesin
MRPQLAVAAIHQAVREGYEFLASKALQCVSSSEFRVFDRVIGDVADAGWQSLLHTLLCRGAGVEVLNQQAQLCSRFILERPHIVRRLIMAGALVDVRDNEGRTPIVHATASRFLDSVRVLHDSGASLQVAFGERRQTALHAMAGEPDDGMEALLIGHLTEHGVAIDTRDADGETPLHYATTLNRPALIRALVEAGADINVQNEYGFTPVSLASRHGYAECVKALVEGGAQIEARDVHGGTPLINGAGCPRTVEILLSAGANVMAVAKDGSTALHVAASWKNAECCRMLVARGADPTAKDRDGRTPLDIAIEEEASDCISCLAAMGRTIPQSREGT